MAQKGFLNQEAFFSFSGDFSQKKETSRMIRDVCHAIMHVFAAAPCRIGTVRKYNVP